MTPSRSGPVLLSVAARIILADFTSIRTAWASCHGGQLPKISVSERIRTA
jgi:hypothetical protein